MLVEEAEDGLVAALILGFDFGVFEVRAKG